MTLPQENALLCWIKDNPNHPANHDLLHSVYSIISHNAAVDLLVDTDDHLRAGAARRLAQNPTSSLALTESQLDVVIAAISRRDHISLTVATALMRAKTLGLTLTDTQRGRLKRVSQLTSNLRLQVILEDVLRTGSTRAQTDVFPTLRAPRKDGAPRLARV